VDSDWVLWYCGHKWAYWTSPQSRTSREHWCCDKWQKQNRSTWKL